MSLNNRLDTRDVPSFRSGGWVERSIVWAGRHRLARKADTRTSESSEAFLDRGSRAMLLRSALSEMFVFDHALSRF